MMTQLVCACLPACLPSYIHTLSCRSHSFYLLDFTDETLPIFLDSLMSGLVAVLVSTVLVLIFGEIVPSGEYYLSMYSSGL